MPLPCLPPSLKLGTPSKHQPTNAHVSPCSLVRSSYIEKHDTSPNEQSTHAPRQSTGCLPCHPCSGYLEKLDSPAKPAAAVSDASLHQALLAAGTVVCIRRCYMHKSLGNPTLDPLRWAGAWCCIVSWKSVLW